MADDGRARCVVLGKAPLDIESVLAAARGELGVELDSTPAYRERLLAGRRVLDETLRAQRPVYGVTTGVGSSITTEVRPDERSLLPLNLIRFHGCGTGRLLGEVEAASVLTIRLATLARGYSAVRPELLERLCTLLRDRILPCIPEEGSVGASGDLTPLSYLAALVVGEREALVAGEPRPAADALSAAGLAPLRLEPKESLALMNGTSVMTALACVAFERAERLAVLAAVTTGMVASAIGSNPDHFAAEIFALKPHAGTCTAGRWIRETIDAAAAAAPARLQDRYSIRCAPHVIGVLLDALAAVRPLIETEINGVDDNPMVDPDTGRVLHGGNFYGGHIALAMDTLKAAVAGVADLQDRQIQLLCCPDTSGGLPANLVRGDVHHGFKAMQISTSALAAEALKLTMPAASFSRSTESHNQDKVSMGTIAARDAIRILELGETVSAIVLLAACQGLDLGGCAPAGAGATIRDRVREVVPPLDVDRRQDGDIARVLELVRSGALHVVPGEE